MMDSKKKEQLDIGLTMVKTCQNINLLNIIHFICGTKTDNQNFWSLPTCHANTSWLFLWNKNRSGSYRSSKIPRPKSCQSEVWGSEYVHSTLPEARNNEEFSPCRHPWNWRMFNLPPLLGVYTLPKLNGSPQKESCGFQPSIFRCKLLVSVRVYICRFHVKI